MPITDYDGQLQTIARNLGEEPALTNTDGLLEAIAKGTENIVTEDKLDDYLPLAGGTMTGDLEVNGNLTQGGKVVERVNASGENYIRYESGLQICFASVGNMSASTTITFPVPFIDVPFIVSGTNSSSANSSVTALTASSFTANMETYDHAYRYIAIGYWK